MKSKYLTMAPVVLVLVLVTPSVVAQQVGLIPTEENVETAIKEPGYSPYAGRNFPTRVLWGDTHLHTNLSLDARAFGVTSTISTAAAAHMMLFENRRMYSVNAKIEARS